MDQHKLATLLSTLIEASTEERIQLEKALHRYGASKFFQHLNEIQSLSKRSYEQLIALKQLINIMSGQSEATQGWEDKDG